MPAYPGSQHAPQLRNAGQVHLVARDRVQRAVVPASLRGNRALDLEELQQYREPQWRKSTRSQGQNDCVEITDEVRGSVGVRDSKLGDASPVLAVTVEQWRLFRASVRAGRGRRRPAVDGAHRARGDHLPAWAGPHGLAPAPPRHGRRAALHCRQRDAFLAGLDAGELGVSAGAELAALAS
nr:DUF397 domain-containing protein [Saccharomonospora sp. CUA-673]